jgi:hypothetical protein
MIAALLGNITILAPVSRGQRSTPVLRRGRRCQADRTRFLLADAKPGKDLPQQIVGRVLPGDGAEFVLREAQFLGIKLGPTNYRLGAPQARRGALKGNNMPLTRQEQILACRLPARDR